MEEDKFFSLEKQLHKQYAKNTNSHISSFISFLVAIIVVFGAFGYVYVFSVDSFSINRQLVVNVGPNCSNTFFYLDVVCYLYCVSMLVVSFLTCLCIHLGSSQRRDQIIIERIRKKNSDEDEYNSIFGNSYQAANKCFCNFIPDYYLIFILFFCIVAIIMSIATFSKVGVAGFSNIAPSKRVPIIFGMMFYVFPILCYQNAFDKYCEQCK